MCTRKSLITLIAILFLTNGLSSQAQTGPPQEWKVPALKVVAWFETKSDRWDVVTPDFDCNGISAGILQWNVGKGLLTKLLNRFPAQTVDHFMPTYGKELIKNLNISTKHGLQYVQKFQKYKNPQTCNGNKRGASWTTAGKLLHDELSALLGSNEGPAIQIAFADDTANLTWRFAQEWSLAARGNLSPTYTEFLFFYDTINFNGTFWECVATYKKVSELRAKGNQKAFEDVISYLKKERSQPYYQTWDADQNVTIWGSKQVNDDQIVLLLHGYIVAQNIKKKSAIPFRLNVISRRGTIVFQDGFVNHTRKSIPPPN